MVQGKGSARIVVEEYPQAAEAGLHHEMISVHDLLRGDPLAVGADRNRHAVLVGTADEEDITPFVPLIANVDISRHVGPCKVPQVERAVRVRQSRRHKNLLGQSILPCAKSKSYHSFCPVDF